jgi:hypothetical protein
MIFSMEKITGVMEKITGVDFSCKRVVGPSVEKITDRQRK